MKLKKSVFIISAGFFIAASLNSGSLPAQDASAYDWYDYQPEQKSIKTVNGKFYAYIVLLFNENPHFVNIIQKDTIPLKVIGDEGFHIKAYKSYLNTLRDGPMGKLAQQMLAVYLEPTKYNDSHLAEIENALVKYNIILRFSKDKNSGSDRIILDYCIFGKKVQVTVKHPLFEIREKIYNIQPFIYYDEFSTSNSTFYFNMIYINPDEVNNDYIIAKRIINGENVNSMFFVGSRVTENMRYCLQRSFRDKKSIKEEIWKMFAIHELTHKVLNNKYNCFDQVTGEELSLSGTIYYNPFLGLSILYSYLNYNSINPHRVAAVNFIKFVAERQGKNEMVAKPGLLKNMTESELRTMAREHFNFMLEKVK